MRFFLVLACFLFSAACISGRRSSEVDRLAQVDPEHAVWASVLATFISDSTRQLVIVDSARPIPERIINGQTLSARFPEINAEFIRRYVEANASSRAMPAFADVEVPVVRVTDAALAPFRGAGGPNEYWNGFYGTYPDSPGLIRLFRVGFDPLMEQALVFVTHSCGGRCGSGTYTLLSKVNGVWVVVGRSVALAN